MTDKEIRPSAFKGCVTDEPFSNYTLNVGPGKLTTSHCLTRSLSDGAKKFMTSSAVSTLSKSSTFEVFRTQLEAVSDDGHVMLGGEMSSAYSSPGGEYLHHNLLFLTLNTLAKRPSFLLAPRQR